jgi:hypothetical protein
MYEFCTFFENVKSHRNIPPNSLSRRNANLKINIYFLHVNRRQKCKRSSLSVYHNTDFNEANGGKAPRILDVSNRCMRIVSVDLWPLSHGIPLSFVAKP